MRNKILLGVVVTAVVAFVALRRGGNNNDVQPETLDQNVMLDRFWIDHVPQNDRDLFNVFVAITEQPLGIFDKTSRWVGNFELFQYEAHDGELRVLYGQTGEREQIKAKATRCNEGGMDYCLELAGASRGVKKYYSMEGWVIEGADSLDHLRDRIAALMASPDFAKARTPQRSVESIEAK